MGHVQAVRAGDREPTEPKRNALTEDELYQLLSNRRRRHILHRLIREDDALDVGTLSREIAAREDDLAYEDVSSSDRKRVYTALQQSHLPKLDETGVVDFDRDRGTVEPTPVLEDVEIYLNLVRGREFAWSDYYLGVTVLIGIVLAGVTFEVTPFTAVPDGSWMFLVIVALGVSTLAHRYYSRRNRPNIGDDPANVELEYRDSTDR